MEIPQYIYDAIVASQTALGEASRSTGSERDAWIAVAQVSAIQGVGITIDRLTTSIEHIATGIEHIATALERLQ